MKIMSKLIRPNEFDQLAVSGFIVDALRREFEPWANGISANHPDDGSIADDVTAEQGTQADAALRDAYDRGFEEGWSHAQEEAERKIAALSQIISGLDRLRPCGSKDLAVLLATVVDRLLRDVLDVSVPDAGALRARINHAADMVIDVSEPAVLQLNPLDAQLLEPVELPVTVETNHSLTRGEFRLLTAMGGIEDGPELRLQQLKTALEHLCAE